MTTPTRKQVLVESLKALHKARLGALFRIKALGRQQRVKETARRAALQDLANIERKMQWEMTTNGQILKDRQ